VLSPSICTRVPNGAPSLFRRLQSHCASLASARFRRKRLTCIGTSRPSNSLRSVGSNVAKESYEFIEREIQECDLSVQRQLAQLDSRAQLPNPANSLKAQLHRVCGVDLTKIPGIKEQAAQVIISEVGLDMTKWKTEKEFSSFLGLCLDNSISGGKVLRRSTRKVYDRAADALRLSAQSLTRILRPEPASLKSSKISKDF